MSRLSQSVTCREKGNKFYTSALADGISACLQKSRLKEALVWYEKAKRSSTKQEEKCSAAKNIGMASKKLAVLVSQRNESVNDRHYYFKEALSNFDISYRFGSCKSHEWLDGILVSYQETIQDAINDVNLLDFEQKIRALEDYSQCIVNAANHRGELLIEIAQMRFHHGISSLQKDNYKVCLYQMHECYRPIEEARKFGKDQQYIMTEVKIMEQDIFVHTCIAESAQARLKGDAILEQLLLEEENLNMDMVWKVVDLYKEAIILTRENDMEVEAIALSRLGNVNDKVLKDKIKAKGYFRRAIQLAMSLHPRTFDSEDWFKTCHNVLERYQKEVMQHESDVWNKERIKYIEQLKEELKLIKEAAEESDGDLLHHIYTTHPPKGKDCSLGEVPEKGDCNYHSEMKPLFRKAVIHYHPDKADAEKDGKTWKVLCEEISKYLTQKYEGYK